MLISPAPLVCVPGPLAVVDVVCSVTLLVARLVTIVLAAAASTVRSVGSTSQVPVVPLAARVSTLTPVKSIVLPDVSINPPLPLVPVARADKCPLAVVLSPMTMIDPALPLALSTVMLPPSLTTPLLAETLRASTLSGRFTTLRTALRAASPLTAACVPSVETSADGGSATCRKLPPFKSSVAWLTAPMTTLPMGAAIRPFDMTLPPSSPT